MGLRKVAMTLFGQVTRGTLQRRFLSTNLGLYIYTHTPHTYIHTTHTPHTYTHTHTTHIHTHHTQTHHTHTTHTHTTHTHTTHTHTYTHTPHTYTPHTHTYTHHTLTLSRGGKYYGPVKYVQSRYKALLLYSVFILQPEDGNKLWYLPADPTWQLLQLRILSVFVYV
jgi:hypothetical protein